MRQTDRTASPPRRWRHGPQAPQEVVAIARAAGADTGGDQSADDYEYRPLRIDASTSRASAAVMLSVRAEFTGWELARVLRFPDGSRRVTLRRQRSAGPVPALSL